jgi:GNAT superfamily N-acetyltransferase
MSHSRVGPRRRLRAFLPAIAGVGPLTPNPGERAGASPLHTAPMEIGPATESDLEAVLPLMRAYCDFYEVAPSDDGLEAMARALIAAADAEGMLLVARDGNGEPIGFAAVGWKWASTRGARIAVMEDLFVAPEARGQGAADSLIKACADRVRELGAPVLTWMTAPDNHRAQAVYSRAGATPGTWLEYELELD